MFHEFLDNTSFPKDRSAEYPHIVDIQTWVGSVQTTASGNIPESHTLKVWDAIATLLNAVDPAFCTDFFDLTQDGYSVTAFEKNSKEGVLIWRRGNKVFVGTFDNERFQNLIYEWEVIVRCTIATDGAWTIDSASDGASSMNTLDHIWDGTYEDDFLDNSEAGKADRGFSIAEEIMGQLPYDPKLWHWEATPN